MLLLQIAMTRIETVKLGPIAVSAGECMNNGWEKTVRNLVICVRPIAHGTCQKLTKHSMIKPIKFLLEYIRSNRIKSNWQTKFAKLVELKLM